jgi:hypothetical protein
MEQQTIKIPNFKLNVFRNLLDQALMVNSQLTLEFGPEMLKSCSFSLTDSFMKFWTIPTNNLIFNEDTQNIDDQLSILPTVPSKPKTELNFPVFDFYILKGDLFKKYLSVHTADTVDLEFVLHKNGKKFQGASMTIIGTSESNSPLTTSFILTTEDLISNKIDDYSKIIKECTPSENAFQFILTNNQIQEIKRLIKQLHKSTPDNTSYLTFTIDTENQKIIVNDKVFTIDFVINQENKNSINLPEENFRFNILKSDFIMTGNHTFSIYTVDKEQKVIFGTNYANSIMMCLTSKVSEHNMTLNDSMSDISIDELELDEYIVDL